MTPTSLFELLKNSQKDFDPELVEKYKRLDSGAIEMAIRVLKNLQDWLYSSSMNGGSSMQREAIDIAIAALEEKVGGCA